MEVDSLPSLEHKETALDGWVIIGASGGVVLPWCKIWFLPSWELGNSIFVYLTRYHS